MLLTPDRRLPRTRNDLDSPFAMDILGEKGEWRVGSASPAARYRATSPVFSPLESPAPPRSPPPPSPPMPTLGETARAARRTLAKEPPPPPVARSAPRALVKEPGLVKVPPPVPDEDEKARRKMTMNAIARAARRRDGARVVGNAMRRLSGKQRDAAFRRWHVLSKDERCEEQEERSDKVNTLLQAVRQLEGRLSNALAAQQDVNKAGAARLASIFRNRERRAVRHAWLSLRATMYVAVDVAAYKAMEKERREAEAARIAAVRNAAEHQIALDAADAARAAAERNNANIVEDARAQLDAAEALRSNLSDGLEAAHKELEEARAETGAANDAAEDATAIAVERAERIHELERSLAEAVALQVARAELEERLARERDGALGDLDAAKRDHDEALARERRRQDAVRCAHDDELSELQSAAAARERKDTLYRMKMVSSARRSGASFCFMVLRRWRKGRVTQAWRSWADATARRRVARAKAERFIRRLEHKRAAKAWSLWEAEARDRAEKRRRALETLLNRRASNVLGQWRRSAAERRRQNMALEALVKRRASNVLGQWRRRATEKRRQSIALEALAKKRASNIVARWRQHASMKARTNSAARRLARCLRGWLHRGTYRAFGKWRRAVIHEGVLEYVGRAQSAGQPDVRRLSSAVSNVDGFTLVEGEATPLTFKGRPMLRVTALFEGQGGGQRPRPSAGRPLDTVANLARTSRRTPKATRTPRARAANVRRTLTAGADFAVPPVRQSYKQTWGD
jgi:hypothetical protein